MDFIRKTILFHGGKEVHFITPMHASPYIIATEFKGYYFVSSNSIGYAVIKDMLIAASVLEKNEIIHMPLCFQYNEAFQTDFPEPESFFTSLIFMNYHTCQMKTKDIILAINAPTSKQGVITRSFPLADDPIEHWKSRRRLTVKSAGKNLILSSNRDVFTNMAQSCQSLSLLEDDEGMNNYPPHMHHDWDENTAKSVGITFYYWTPPMIHTTKPANMKSN